MLMQISYTAFIAIAALQLAQGFLQDKMMASEAEHELWIRCVLAFFYRLGFCRGCGYG